jgi:hypothetical protein
VMGHHQEDGQAAEAIEGRDVRGMGAREGGSRRPQGCCLDRQGCGHKASDQKGARRRDAR